MLELLKEMAEVMRQELKEKEAELKSCPIGSMSMQKSSKTVRLYWYRPEKKKNGIKRVPHRLHEEDYSIVRGLRRKRLCMMQIRAYRINLKWIQKAIQYFESCDEATLEKRLKEPYRTIPGFEHLLEINHKPIQSENPFKRERLKFQNSIGELFRSKAEMQISELLMKYKIPYRYEKLLEYKGEQKYPDFTVKRDENGKKKYIEYFGMTDSEDYIPTMVERINWYLDKGFVPGRDVLFLFGNNQSGMDSMTILKQIYALLDA